MSKYEVMYIIRPNIEDEAKKAVVERFNGILTDNGAELMIQKIGVNAVLHTKSMISVMVTTN